jgi:hypothetical protein
MENKSAQPSLRCTQCGAELEIREGEVLVTCAHCTSALYVDRGQVVFHYLVARTLDARTATETLKRWMSGSKPAKNLDRLADIEQPVLRYFPIWRFRVVDDSGEQLYAEPAATETLPLFREVTIPAGELRFFRDHDLAPLLVRPTVSHETALGQFRAAEAGAPSLHEVALVHVPLYLFQYRYGEEAYHAAVDAASGEVLSSVYPARQDLAYHILGVVSFAAFLLAAFSLYGLLYVAGEKLVPALSLRCGVQLLLALLLFFPAWLVARKV